MRFLKSGSRRIPQLLMPLLLIMGALAGSIAAEPAFAARRAPAQVAPKRQPAIRPAPPPLPAASPAAIAAHLRKEAKGKLKSFYAARNYAPLWAATGRIGPGGDALVIYVGGADLDGLRASSYKAADLRRAIDAANSSLDPRAMAKAEVALSKALTRYVRDLRKYSKRDLALMTWADKRLVPPKKVAEDAVLKVGARAGSFDRFVSNMEWMSPQYVRLRRTLGQAVATAQPAATQERIRINLKRARLLPGPWTQHILVDAASGRLWYFEAGQQRGTMRVVVGKQASPTPMLVGSVQFAILDPYWNIPVDLAQTLIAPKVLKGRTLQMMNMEALSDWTDRAQVLDPATIDWNAVAAGTRELRVRQLPGPYNSMGRVKFMFPNELGIYLHDTPERELLAKDNRHFSNGCIRLEDAPGLAKWLLGQPLVNNPRKPEQVVTLRYPVPVYVTYLTVAETPPGATIAMLEDVYSRDVAKR